MVVGCVLAGAAAPPLFRLQSDNCGCVAYARIGFPRSFAALCVVYESHCVLGFARSQHAEEHLHPHRYTNIHTCIHIHEYIYGHSH
jgi:hypothetical protein